MKKIILLSTFLVSIIIAEAQVDPAFTNMLVNIANTAKAYYLSQTPANLQSAIDAVYALQPIANSEFASKLSSMLGSNTEMGKFSTPVSFVQCLGVAAGQHTACVNAYVEQTGDIPPGPPYPLHCYDSYQSAIIQCAITHLTR